MKRGHYIFLFVLIAAPFSFSSPLIAGGVINNQTFSTEYIRTFSRNAATDSSDAVVYNPAGVMGLKNGNYINLSLSHVMKNYSNTIDGIEYESTMPSEIPAMNLLYKTDAWATFFAVNVPAGGGAVDFKDGNGSTLAIAEAFGGSSADAQRLKSFSYHLGYTFGGAYRLNEKLSLSLGARYVEASRGSDGDISSAIPPDKVINVQYTEHARGLGWIAGANYMLSDKTNVGLRYETGAKLNFKRDTKRDDTGSYPDDVTTTEDLPGIIAVGVGHKITPETAVMLSLTQYREADANLQSSKFDRIKNSYEVALAVEKVINSKLKGSLGYMYTETRIPNDDMSKESPPLGANTICGGVAYTYSPETVLNFGISTSIYPEGSTSNTSSAYDPAELDKEVTTLALGIEHRF